MALTDLKERAKRTSKATTAPAAQPEQTPAAGQRINPEIDARLTAFIADNPKLHEHYMSLSKETLVRKVMLTRMQKQDIAEKQHERLLAWAAQDPKLVARLDEVRQRNLPAEKERGIIKAIVNSSMRQQALAQQRPAAGLRP